MCESCDEWKLGCVRVKDCLSYVDGQWCVGNLVCGGFSVSNYLQGNLGTRRHDHFLLAGEILPLSQAQAEEECRGDSRRKSGRSKEEQINGETYWCGSQYCKSKGC